MEPKQIKIALAGNPNSGKTTLFNKLTGSRQRIGNWPGVTIEKKEGTVKAQKHVTVQDLPGIYSLSPYTPEEEISREYLLKENPDVVLNIVDSSNLERNLYLTTQLLELGIPVVVALNFIDQLRRDGDVIHARKLEERLGCPVIETSALKGEGVEACIARCISATEDSHDRVGKTATLFSADVEKAIQEIESVIGDTLQERRRWTAIKAFERDEKALAGLSLTSMQKDLIEDVIRRTEEKMDDDSESIITAGRYAAIRKITDGLIARAERKDDMSRSDRIDRLVTHRFWAYPIFIAVMFAVYYIAVGFGLSTQDMVDGLFGDTVIPFVTEWMEGIGASGWLVGLVADGIIGGVGSVLVFVPQILILFVLLGIIEDIGYMARIAFILDRLFRRFGLSGKSFIPMLIGTGCSVPGIMASRTIESQRDRRMTIINTPMIPCGAKLPIIALIAGAMFGGAWWVAPLAYFLGLFAVIVSGIILKKTTMFQGDPAPFVMELPDYHLPSVGNVARSMWERGWSFIKRAGTVILLSSIVLWFLLHFAVVDGSLVMIEDEMIADSIAAKVGTVLGHLFAPIGFGGWQASVATVTGLIAKEEVVSTFGVIFRIEDALGLVEEGEFGGLAAIAKHFTQLSAFSFMLFNLFCPPCFAAMGAIKREMNSAKWTWFAIGYLFVFAYVLSFIVYQIGILFTGGAFNVYSSLAVAMLLGSLYLLFRKPRAGAVVSD